MSQYFPKPYNQFGGNVKVEVDLSNYTKKTDLKGATGIGTFNLALKSNLSKLKTEVDEIDVEKVKTVPVDLSKLNVVKVNAIDTSGFVLKTKYDTDKSSLEKKSLMKTKKAADTSGVLVKKIDYNAKITEIEDKIPSITGLATTSALTALKIRYLMLAI